MQANQDKSPSKISTYWSLTKPRLWLMLTYTAVVGFVASLKVQSDPNYVLDGLLVVVTVGLATSGANAITCYLDRDVDSIMERTRNRPIPSGRVKPPEHALHFGVSLATVSIILLLLAGKFVAVLVGLLGLFDNVVVYSYYLKRRSPLNVILGGFSGGAPVIIGWSVNADILNPIPFLMASMVVLWIPSHIWSLALKWRDDYSRAGIPMLTATIDPKNAVRCLASTSVLIVLFSLILPSVGPFGTIYLIVAVATGFVLLCLTAWLIINPIGPAPHVLFKYTSPYLAVLLATMII